MPPSYPTVSSSPAIQAFYEQMRRRGESHMIADMLAHQQGPTLKTDTTFFSDNANGKQFANDPKRGERYRKVAERLGGSVKGKKYLSTLAEFPGDPRAWVDTVGDIRRVCEERGYNCEDLGIKAEVKEEPKPVRLAPDLVDKHVKRYRKQDPKLAAKPVQEVREMVIEKHGRKA